MPSACTKPENKASGEAVNQIERCITIVEKKVRNLEKRKGKLDGYRDQRAKGEILNEDQTEAIGKYDSVIQTLEFAKELQKQFQSISGEMEKLMKKKAKKERAEKQEQEIARIREILKLQDLLSNMGSEEVREDFRKGANGAVTLTEENLEQLDEVYKLITPSREGETSFVDQLTKASEHIVSFLEAKDKEVAGSTYKQLKELADQINECGYFDNLTKREEAPAAVGDEPETVTETVEAKAEEPAALASQEPQQTETVEPTPTIAEPQPIIASEPVVPLMEQEILPPASALVQAPVSAGPPAGCPESAVVFEDDSFFSTAQYQRRQRGFQEIVSSVQGNFNFLQDSEIDLDSPHRVDPAVVASRPMAPGMGRSHLADSGLPPNSYQGSSRLANDDQTASAASTYSQQVAAQSAPDVSSHHAAAQPVSQSQHVTPDSLDFGAAANPSINENIQQSTASQLQFGAVDSLVPDSQNASSLANSSQQQVQSMDAVYDQTYGQNLMSQTLGGSASSQHVPSYAELSASSQISSHMSLQDQSVDSMGSASASTGPQPIPLPSQTLPGQSLMSQGFSDSDNAASSQQEKKPYTMNPNADPFKSTTMFNPNSMSSSSGPTHGGANSLLGQEEPHKTAWNTVTQHQPQHHDDHDPQDEYQGSGFGGSSHFGRNSGGPQRGGGRGGSRGGRGSMNNGYSRGGSRGGSSYSGSRGGGGGGFSNGRGGRGGSAWQGYPSRSDYRPEGGYQGYGNTFNNSGMRGGPPRGGGNNPRGGRGGNSGFARPNNSSYGQ